MANVNDEEEALSSNLILEKNDSTSNVESDGTTSEYVKMSIEDSVVVQGKEKEETTKVVVISEEILKEDLKGKEKDSKKSYENIALGGTSNEITKVEGSGMIFMCNSKTKKDCYHYKVLGLPASKKDTVSKIYRGMRLFLFDFDLKLMYGIYKAAGKGGYNIEPKAFNSAYPSQVRFTVLEDCLPLAEEKFKTVIKDNYYTRNKFNCQLTSEQVKKLCKIFQAANKEPKARRLGRGTRADIQTIVEAPNSERFVRGISASNHSLVDLARSRLRYWEQERHQRYHEGLVVHEREAFASPGVALSQRRVPAPPVPLPQRLAPPLPPSHAYDRPLDRDLHERENPLLEHHELRRVDHGQRVGHEIESIDPYVLYQEPPLYHDRVQSVGVPIEYHSPQSRSLELPPLRPSYQ